MLAQPPESSATVRLWPLVKWLIFFVLLIFIARRGYQIWEAAPKESIEIRGRWLLLAGVAYLVTWLPSVWFWRELLLHLKQPLSVWDATQAYYIGNMGKYVPGKAMVLVIRGSLAKEKGVNPIQAGAAAAYETLVFMATGTALALAFVPFTLSETSWARNSEWISSLRQYRILWPVTVMAFTFATTPFSAWLFTRLSRRIAPKQTDDSPAVPMITAGLICKGVAVTAVGWILLTLSLAFVLQSISPQELDWSQFTTWLASTAVSMISGFAVLIAPGGIGVREGMMVETLKDQPQIGAHAALIAAGLLRGVGFLTEVIAAVFFLITRSVSKPDANKEAPSA